jgi:hypothetical protein
MGVEFSSGVSGWTVIHCSNHFVSDKRTAIIESPAYFLLKSMRSSEIGFHTPRGYAFRYGKGN